MHTLSTIRLARTVPRIIPGTALLSTSSRTMDDTPLRRPLGPGPIQFKQNNNTNERKTPNATASVAAAFQRNRAANRPAHPTSSSAPSREDVSQEGASRMTVGDLMPELNTSSARQLEGLLATRLASGDVYTPYSLSPGEHNRVKRLFSHRGRINQPLLTRRRAHEVGGDVIDQTGIDPVAQYKNFAMLSEWVTPLGRIRSARELGLRRRNHRKVAKAVRRAVGLGIFPSVHKHPELFPERMEQRALLDWKTKL